MVAHFQRSLMDLNNDIRPKIADLGEINKTKPIREENQTLRSFSQVVKYSSYNKSGRVLKEVVPKPSLPKLEHIVFINFMHILHIAKKYVLFIPHCRVKVMKDR